MFKGNRCSKRFSYSHLLPFPYSNILNCPLYQAVICNLYDSLPFLGIYLIVIYNQQTPKLSQSIRWIQQCCCQFEVARVWFRSSSGTFPPNLNLNHGSLENQFFKVQFRSEPLSAQKKEIMHFIVQQVSSMPNFTCAMLAVSDPMWKAAITLKSWLIKFLVTVRIPCGMIKLINFYLSHGLAWYGCI